MHVASRVREHNPNSTHPTASTVRVSLQLLTLLRSWGWEQGELGFTNPEESDIQLQSPPARVPCIMPAATPCVAESILLNTTDMSLVRALTQSAVVIPSQMMELAMLASKCTAPSTIQSK